MTLCICEALSIMVSYVYHIRYVKTMYYDVLNLLSISWYVYVYLIKKIKPAIHVYFIGERIAVLLGMAWRNWHLNTVHDLFLFLFPWDGVSLYCPGCSWTPELKGSSHLNFQVARTTEVLQYVWLCIWFWMTYIIIFKRRMNFGRKKFN
jgi:hypothetical protein